MSSSHTLNMVEGGGIWWGGVRCMSHVLLWRGEEGVSDVWGGVMHQRDARGGGRMPV